MATECYSNQLIIIKWLEQKKTYFIAQSMCSHEYMQASWREKVGNEACKA